MAESARTVRAFIASRFPELEFKVRTISFVDLARGDAVFVESEAWRKNGGDYLLYVKVKKAVKDEFPHGVVVEW